jgi:hypothetical protein
VHAMKAGPGFKPAGAPFCPASRGNPENGD